MEPFHDPLGVWLGKHNIFIPFLWKAEIFAAHQEQWLWEELQHGDLEQSGPEDLACNACVFKERR